jgi:hypothetical protein
VALRQVTKSEAAVTVLFLDGSGRTAITVVRPYDFRSQYSSLVGVTTASALGT